MKRFMFALTFTAALALGSSASVVAQERFHLTGSCAIFPAPTHIS